MSEQNKIEYKGIGGPMPLDANTTKFISDMVELLRKRADNRMPMEKIRYIGGFICASFDKKIQDHRAKSLNLTLAH